MLTKFRLVKTDGLKGLFLKGRFIAFDKIDDTLAEQLIGKTHVLERVSATIPVPAGELPVATAAVEQPATSRGRRNNE
jgi:hypothetical protein